MTTPDIEKKRKKRGSLSGYVHANLNKPVDMAALTAVMQAIALDRRDAGEDSMDTADKGRKGKGRGRRLRALEALHSGNVPTPQHEAAAAEHEEMARGDLDKGQAGNLSNAVSPGSREAAGHTGNPVSHIQSPTGNYQDRVSGPVTEGHAACSTGDHGASQGRGYYEHAAWNVSGHPDGLQQQGDLAARIFGGKLSPATRGFAGAAALSAAQEMSSPLKHGEPDVQSYMRSDHAQSAGMPAFGRNTPSGAPLNAREADHSVPCNSNGGHSTSGSVVSTAVSGKADASPAGKALTSSEARAVLKEAMRQQGITG